MALVIDAQSAIVLIDLQNDFLSPDGAYARGGVGSPELVTLPGRLAPVLEAARTVGVPIISTQFTLLAMRGREPLIPAHLAEKRPFLRRGDFAPGSRGHALVDALAPADVVVQKVAFSAFHASPLQTVLSGLGIHRVIVAGILTNGGVASTVRAAHVLGYETWVVSDGCADLQPQVHELALASLVGTSQLIDCATLTAALADHRAA